MTTVEGKLINPKEVRVAHILDHNKVVINKGSQDGIKVGASFLFVAEGPEIFDPVSGANLGKLELVRGTGIVVSCQGAIATVRSTRKREVRKARNPLVAALDPFPLVEYEDLPFDGIEVGDIGRPV